MVVQEVMMAAGFELTVTVAANRIIRCFVTVVSMIRQGRAARIAQTRILRLCVISSSLLHRLVNKPRSAGSRAALHFVTASSPLRLRFRFASPLIRHRPLIGCNRLGCRSNCSNYTRTRPLCHRLLSVSSRRRQRVICHHRSLVLTEASSRQQQMK